MRRRNRWTADQKDAILKVYKAGNKLSSISSNPNWVKRSSVMEGLDDGSLEPEEDATASDAQENTEEEGE